MVLTLQFLFLPSLTMSRCYVNIYTSEAQLDKPTKPAGRKVLAASAPSVAIGQGSKKTLDASRVEECLQRHVVNAMNRNVAIANFKAICKAAENELNMPGKSINRKVYSSIIKATAVSHPA
jgi:hypothetical protein